MRQTKKQIYEKHYSVIVKNPVIKKSLHTRPVVKTGKKECEVLKECTAYLKSLQCYRVTVQRNNTGFGDLRGTGNSYQYGIKHAGDLICSIDGKYVEIECKHGSGGTWSKEQIEHAEKIRSHGGLYFIVHSKDELAEAIKPYLPDIFKELEILVEQKEKSEAIK